MLQFFRNNQLSTLPLVVVYFCIFYVALWLQPTSAVDTSQWSQLSQFVNNLLGNTPTSQRVLWGLLVLVQVFGLNFTVNTYKLSKRYTFISAVSLVLVYGFIPFDLNALPLVMSNTFLLLALYHVLGCYDKKGASGPVFNSGFWLSVAALFDWSASIFAIFIFFAWLLQRSFNWREFVLWYMGLTIPIFWAWLYFFIYGDTSLWLSTDISGRYAFPQLSIQGWPQWLALGIWGVLVLWCLINLSQIQQKTTLQEQKHISSLAIMLVNAPLTVFLFAHAGTAQLTCLVLPVAALMSLQIQVISSNARAELSHWFLFMAAAAIQYQFLFK